jgi:uncharacterized protein YkwD
MSRTALVGACLLLWACEASVIRWEDAGTGADIHVDTGADSLADQLDDTAADAPSDTVGTDTAGDTATDTGTDTAADPVEEDPPPATLCDRWRADRADLSEGAWSGNVTTCDEGDVSSAGRDNALRQVNLFRWMAELPPVALDATRNGKSQECALMMHANGTLSHSPPPSWACYTADGAEAAGSSNIATGPGVMAVDMYMQDWGNESTMGHRRWILSNSLGPIGVGSTSEYSCMWVLYGSGGAGASWTSWPPPGDFPIQAVRMSWRPLDETGWTIQSDSINVGSGTVTITAGGTDMPVDVRTLLSGYGSTYAISIIPRGWSSTVGTTYHVEVTGVSPAISYDVTIVDCS